MLDVSQIKKRKQTIKHSTVLGSCAQKIACYILIWHALFSILHDILKKKKNDNDKIISEIK